MRRVFSLIGLFYCIAAGCWGPPAPPRPVAPQTSARLQTVSIDDPLRPVMEDEPSILHAARNEWTSVAVRLSSPPPAGWLLRFRAPAPRSGPPLPLTSLDIYQVLSTPIDVNRAAYVRHTGLTTAARRLPRALLKLDLDSAGRLDLSSLRDPAQPGNPRGRATASGEPPLLWVDLHVPSDAAPGDYQLLLDLLQGTNPLPALTLPIPLTVYDFALPDERSLQMVGRLPWDRLDKLFPEGFEAVTPRLLNRADPRYADTIRTLDQLIGIAQEHRMTAVVPRLQPTVKWPAGEAPLIDWRDFDSVVGPWLKGQTFADHVPLRYWPLPPAELLERYDEKSRLDYWQAAATHFDQNDWLNVAPVSIEKFFPGRVDSGSSIELSAQAAQLLNDHPRLRVLAPLEDDQVQFSKASNPALIDPSTTARLLASSRSLVSAPPPEGWAWPVGVETPSHWLRTDLSGLVTYVGAGGSERDVRVWAWLAFLRHAQLILWNNTLPAADSPSELGDPSELVWFYPGRWFGADAPLPTVQLKWLRRAQQDYEYLKLASDRRERVSAVQMARLITKPVEIQNGQTPDPVYTLMSGTTDAAAWGEARRLLAQAILLHQPDQNIDKNAQHDLYIRTLQWAEPQERPLLLSRTASWMPSATQGNWIDLKIGVDIYNASDATPKANQLQWATLPAGWEVKPQPVEVPPLATYRVQRSVMEARVNADRITAAGRQPMELAFINGFTQVQEPLRVVLPVAESARREGRLSIDGSLNDWEDFDSIHTGPLVKMLDRPDLQHQTLQFARTSSRIYTAWAAENFYVAFGLDGLATGENHHGQNFVDYQSRRAWGEDLCEALIQPVYANGALGPVLHLVCKPNGAVWVERRVDTGRSANPWEVVQGAPLRFAASVEGSTWSGELAIPWKAILDPAQNQSPVYLRFNFAQHRTSTGESASWAGPVDFGRDDSFMGLLVLKTQTGATVGPQDILAGTTHAGE